jgi:hypothetical protein
VLEAPFTSAVDVGAQHYWFVPVRLLQSEGAGARGSRRKRRGRSHNPR